jgi:membrane-bound lytic murein transglycosylase D
MNIRVLLSLICLVLMNCIAAANNNDPTKNARKRTTKAKYKVPRYSHDVVKGRLEAYDGLMDVRYTKTVKDEINGYTNSNRKNAERILGRSSMYFKMIEDSLQHYNLPSELKYMTVIESRCDIKAKSPVGAAGLWQFMPATARKYGLRIDNFVDERYDPYRATSAAMKYLKDLYGRFGDWNLAIGSYNCGEGNMQKAMRKAKSKDFWRLRKHLPKETQFYVPKFIAAAYVMDNYLFYDLHPAYPDYDLQLTKTITIYERKSFKQLAEQTGFSVELIQKLNPAYKRGIIPPSSKGRYLIIPRLG